MQVVLTYIFLSNQCETLVVLQSKQHKKKKKAKSNMIDIFLKKYNDTKPTG